MTFVYFLVMTKVLSHCCFLQEEIREAQVEPGGSACGKMVPGSLRAGPMTARPVHRQLRIRSSSLANLSRPLMRDNPENDLREARPPLIHALRSACAPSSQQAPVKARRF